MKLISRIPICLIVIFTTLNLNKCYINEKHSNQDNSFYNDQSKEYIESNFIFNNFQKITENLFEEYYKYLYGFKILMNELYKVFNMRNLQEYHDDINSENKYKLSSPSFKIDRKLFKSSNFNNTTDDKTLISGNFRKLNCGLGKVILVNRTYDSCGNNNFHFNYKYTNTSECELSKTEIIPLCICPITHESCFELNNDLICQFNQLFADNIDLLKNKNTFYFEYLKRPILFYTKNKSINFTVNLKCHNRNFINITEKNYVVKDYGYKNYTILNDTESLKNAFEYFIDENNITTFLQPDLYLKMNILDMKSITQLVSTDIIFEQNAEKLKNILKGTQNITWTLNLEELFSDIFLLYNYTLADALTADRLFYELKLYSDKNSSIAKYYHQGSIDYILGDNQLFISQNNSLSNISIILFLLFLILISILYIIRFFKRKRRNSGDKNIREIMLENQDSLKKS